ncbi:MAG: hypothetical protein C4323_11740 [Mastigocladus sp. ERB_26_2]
MLPSLAIRAGVIAKILVLFSTNPALIACLLEKYARFDEGFNKAWQHLVGFVQGCRRILWVFWSIFKDMNLRKILVFSYTLTPLNPFAQSTNSTVLNFKDAKTTRHG